MRRKGKDYALVAELPRSFRQECNRFLSAGYEPLGGCSVNPLNGELIQAFVFWSECDET